MSSTLSTEAGAQLDPGPIMELGLAFWGSKTLLSAIELGVFTELADEPLALDQASERLGLHERSARDFLDALVALGMLERSEGRYADTPLTAALLDRRAPGYVGGMLEMANSRLYPFWNGLTEALRTGQPQNEIAQGGNLFDTLYADAGKLREFARAMTGVSLGAARTIAERFPFERYATFVDVGCAEGALPAQVALRHPQIAGGGFDLPPLEPIFNDYVASHGLGDRLAFYAGDFWTDDLPAADVLAMGHILHDWNLAEKVTLIEKAHAALPDGGALIVHDALIDDERRERAFGLLMSLNMLIETPGGFDYTGADCVEWMRAAGFRETSVEHLAGPDWMVVGIK